MTLQRNPASTGDFGWLASLLDRLAVVEEELRSLREQRDTYYQEAEVTAYISGPTATVTFDSGNTLVVAVPFGYTPSTGHRVGVIIGPGAATILIRVS